jgi:hypothetical protein
MLSGVRKYGVGLVLAHQDMAQLSDNKKLSHSVISNPNKRVRFRLSSDEAKMMEQGFSGFPAHSLQSLERGQTMMRVGGAGNDFNMNTSSIR